ncbi:hypothetical protein MRX96_040384 [Rhipicephalus microplus]
MLGTFFGRSPKIPNSEAAAYRSMAVVSWIIGTLILESYVQTSITAIRVVPCATFPIRTLEQLSPHPDEFVLSPYFGKIWMDIIVQLYTPDSGLAFPLIRRALHRHGMCSCGKDISLCYQQAHAGTHFVLSSCSDEEVSAAPQWGLTPSDDVHTLPQVAAIHALNPAR